MKKTSISGGNVESCALLGVSYAEARPSFPFHQQNRGKKFVQ